MDYPVSRPGRIGRSLLGVTVGSFIRFALFTVIIVTLLVFVALPVVGGLLIGTVAGNVGLGGDDVKVSIELLGPGLLAGRAESVNLQGDNVSVPHGVVGHLDVTLGDVSLTDHSFSTVSGELTDVTLNGAGASVLVQSVTLAGPSNRTLATGTVSAVEARKLVKQVALSAGVSVDSVQLKNGSITIDSGGKQTTAGLRIAGAALVLDRPGVPSTVLFSPATSEDWQLESVSVTPFGIQLGLNVDAASLAAAFGQGPAPSR